MKMQLRCHRIFVIALLYFLLIKKNNAENKHRLLARILAKQTGATQFEEERYEQLPDCIESKHQLKKRSSDEDVDYEIYQGVVGRPGIDFPIYPRIPKTTFSCRSFGNGYFADMETDCQVFHICEDGRKISFLCPNGTIFQQSELTCDWWFKVNCLGSSGFYAESAEILSKQRIQRLRPLVPVQGFNIVGGGLNIKPKITKNSTGTRHNTKSERRVDSSEQHSIETLDFEDISTEKHINGQKDKNYSNFETNNNENESQITAETSSFVNNNNRKHNTIYNGKYNSDTGRKQNDSKPKFRTSQTSTKNSNFEQRSSHNRNQNKSNKSNYNYSNELTEKSQDVNGRSQKRFQEDKNTSSESNEKSREDVKNSRKTTSGNKYESLLGPIDTNSKSSTSNILKNSDDKFELYKTLPVRNIDKIENTTPLTWNNGHKIVRNGQNSTKSIPFYTPTIPTFVKHNNAEGKLYFNNKGKGNVNKEILPNSGQFRESSISNAEKNKSKIDLTSTNKPSVIETPHQYNSTFNSYPSREFTNNYLTSDTLIEKKKFQSEIPSYFATTVPSITRPTYLPKNSSTPVMAASGAAGEKFLFAPSPSVPESVSRNVNEMLKTINLLKGKLENIDDVKFNAKGREGLEVPPSSGPDALVSLAKYFALESNNNNTNYSNDQSNNKSNTLRSQSNIKLSRKPSNAQTSNITHVKSDVNSRNKSHDISTSLLSEKTVNKYTNLFGLKEGEGKQPKNYDNENYNVEKLEQNRHSVFSQNSSSDSTIQKIAEKPESRKVAQVFSNALTNYLENPEAFREKLVAIRPTIPAKSTAKSNTKSITFVPKQNSTTTAPSTKTTPKYSGVAAEINKKFEVSTSITTEDCDSTTEKVTSKDLEPNSKLEDSTESLLLDSNEKNEFLDRDHTQSFVSSRNEFNLKSIEKTKLQKTTENPWQYVSHREFLDPLTINDGLMKDRKTTTVSPFTYLPKKNTTPLPKAAKEKFEVFSEDYKIEPNTKENLRSQEYQNPWEDILTNNDLPRGSLPSSTGLQRIANKLFGGLNESEALHLKNVMQQAEHNRQVLSLLLLLIQTCDDHNGKALERSRKHLLNALIEMDEKLQNSKTKVSRQKVLPTTTPASIPITTYKQIDSEKAQTITSTYLTTTKIPTTTTTIISTTLTPNIEDTTKFEIRVEDSNDEYSSTTVKSTQDNLSLSSDKRALELLKSLYSLASKFTNI